MRYDFGCAALEARECVPAVAGFRKRCRVGHGVPHGRKPGGDGRSDGVDVAQLVVGERHATHGVSKVAGGGQPRHQRLDVVLMRVFTTLDPHLRQQQQAVSCIAKNTASTSCGSAETHHVASERVKGDGIDGGRCCGRWARLRCPIAATMAASSANGPFSSGGCRGGDCGGAGGGARTRGRCSFDTRSFRTASPTTAHHFRGGGSDKRKGQKSRAAARGKHKPIQPARQPATQHAGPDFTAVEGCGEGAVQQQPQCTCVARPPQRRQAVTGPHAAPMAQC